MKTKVLNFILLISLTVNLYGYFTDAPLTIAFSQVLMCFSFVFDHYRKHKIDRINPILIFAATMMITSIGHFLAFYNIHEKENLYFQYFKYSIEANYTEAMEIFYLGVMFIILGFQMGSKINVSLPKINTNINSYNVYRNIFYVSVILLLSQNAIRLPGSLQKIISLLPILSLFILNIIGSTYNIKTFKTYSVILTVMAIVINLFTSYLRFNIISPLILYVISNIIVNKNVKFLFKFRSIPVLIAMIFFSISFSKLGKLRTKYAYSWEAKLNYLLGDEDESKEDFEEESKKQTILSRATVINQLTQVVRIKKEDGFYYGETLAYLGYVFIPRFLWPDKPRVQQGGWFAERIGLAYRNSYGHLNNSINMTIYGEAYLNFGFYGVFAICIFFGFLVSKLWQSSGELSSYFNLLGVGYSLYLISYATFQMGADIQIFVTFISVYLIFLFISYVVRELYK